MTAVLPARTVAYNRQGHGHGWRQAVGGVR